MKKKILLIICGVLLVFVMVAALFVGDNKEDGMKKLVVAEVAHTIFYAPQYVALEEGYFKEYGLDVSLILTAGADKVTAAVLSNDADIGFCGSEGTMYVYNGGEEDYLKTFAQLTQKDGSFIVARKPYDDFSLSDMKDSYVIGGRAGGMPEMILEWALKQNGIDPRDDLEIDTSIAFAAMGGAFIGGQGDFVALFEPSATIIILLF